MSQEFEKFQGKIWKTGDSFVITIPRGIMKYGGYNDGDELKVMCKKEGV